MLTFQQAEERVDRFYELIGHPHPNYSPRHREDTMFVVRQNIDYPDSSRKTISVNMYVDCETVNDMVDVIIYDFNLSNDDAILLRIAAPMELAATVVRDRIAQHLETVGA